MLLDRCECFEQFWRVRDNPETPGGGLILLSHPETEVSLNGGFRPSAPLNRLEFRSDPNNIFLKIHWRITESCELESSLQDMVEIDEHTLEHIRTAYRGRWSSASFLVAIQIKCISLWLKISSLHYPRKTVICWGSRIESDGIMKITVSISSR